MQALPPLVEQDHDDDDDAYDQADEVADICADNGGDEGAQRSCDDLSWISTGPACGLVAVLVHHAHPERHLAQRRAEDGVKQEEIPEPDERLDEAV